MARKPKRGPQGQVRITGGSWRSRRVAVAEVVALRPSSDRTRETLFNWLGQDLGGQVCADLYAGTGILGLEALSRGAASCDFVESNAVAAATLRESAALLGADSSRCHIIQQPVDRWISSAESRFDLIFADPPFADGNWQELLQALPARLNAGARLYLESPAASQWSWPGSYSLLKETRVGEARLRLFGWAG